jgi:hypothetical protein
MEKAGLRIYERSASYFIEFLAEEDESERCVSPLVQRIAACGGTKKMKIFYSHQCVPNDVSKKEEERVEKAISGRPRGENIGEFYRENEKIMQTESRYVNLFSSLPRYNCDIRRRL